MTYDDVAKRAPFVGEVVMRRYMPPWPPSSDIAKFKGDRRMPEAEIATLLDWIEAGRPEGRAEDRLNVPTWPDGWTMGEPDLVLEMSEEFDVPAEGSDVFRNFVLPIPVSQTRFVRGFEFRPGNPGLVHHARMLLDTSGVARKRDEHESGPGFSEGMALGEAFDPDGHWIGWTPGKQPSLRDTDLAWRIEPGSDLVLELHMLPTGRPEVIRSSLGLYFSDEEPKQTPFILRLGRNDIDIPAGSSNYVIEDSYQTPVHIDVLSVYAHAHFLGRTVEGWAIEPNGTKRDLLEIDDWSFDWQDEYRYREPVSLPKGTRLFMRFSYDNSSENPRNPNRPPSRVTYGWKTEEEMGDLWFQVLARNEADRGLLARDFLHKERMAQIVGLAKQLEVNPQDLSKQKDLAYLNLQAGRLSDAVRVFEGVIEQDPSSVFSWHNLGLALNLQDEVIRARAAYQAALDLDPDHAPSMSNLAVLFANEGQSGEAEALLRRAIQAQPKYVEAYGNLGAILVSGGRIEEAFEVYRRAVGIDPSYGPVQFNLAGLYRQAGRIDVARDHYRAAAASGYERAAELARKALEQMRTETAR
ncbi:MAG: tetratricopeptide repeat protein [Bryobacterales bacterium]|nr:tetratricopeptide repeat protein [Bryobacterales bacterium]